MTWSEDAKERFRYKLDDPKPDHDPSTLDKIYDRIKEKGIPLNSRLANDLIATTLRFMELDFKFNKDKCK